MKKYVLILLAVFLVSLIAGCTRTQVSNGEPTSEEQEMIDAEESEVLDEIDAGLIEDDDDVDIGNII